MRHLPDLSRLLGPPPQSNLGATHRLLYPETDPLRIRLDCVRKYVRVEEVREGCDKGEDLGRGEMTTYTVSFTIAVRLSGASTPLIRR